MNNHIISTKAIVDLRNILAMSQKETVEFEFIFENNNFFIINKNYKDKKVLLGKRIKNISKIFPEPMNPIYDLVELVFDEANGMSSLTIEERNIFILKRFKEITSNLDLNQLYE